MIKMIFIGNRYEITDRPVYIEENKLYNAYDSEKKIDVKIKIIENNRYISLDFIPNLIDESIIIDDLRSPYILRILDVGVHRTVDNLLYYIVYENFRGVSLATLNKGAYLHMDALIRIATQTVKALQAYYNLGKKHGSLRPDNILVNERYEIKIADFGITEANKGTNIRCSGNLKYLSPSQLSIDFTDIKSDLYCLGVILYESVFKKFPFNDAHTEKQLIKAIDKGVIWSKINTNGMNKDFVEIIKRLLERNDNLCYKNYNDVLLSLSHFMYKTSKIDIEAIRAEENQPHLESVLHKTGHVSPDDFYKTRQMYLSDIQKELDNKSIDDMKIVKNGHTDKKSKKKNNGKKTSLMIIILILIIMMVLPFISTFL